MGENSFASNSFKVKIFSHLQVMNFLPHAAKVRGSVIHDLFAGDNVTIYVDVTLYNVYFTITND